MYLCCLLAFNRGTPIILVILAALVLAYSFLLNRTVSGRYIYAMGGNLNAAMMIVGKALSSFPNGQNKMSQAQFLYSAFMRAVLSSI